jgi:hypothetical protein
MARCAAHDDAGVDTDVTDDLLEDLCRTLASPIIR